MVDAPSGSLCSRPRTSDEIAYSQEPVGAGAAAGRGNSAGRPRRAARGAGPGDGAAIAWPAIPKAPEALLEPLRRGRNLRAAERTSRTGAVPGGDWDDWPTRRSPRLALRCDGVEARHARSVALARRPVDPGTATQSAADAAYAQHIRASVRDPILMQAAVALVRWDRSGGRRAAAARTPFEGRNPTDVAALRMLAEVAGSAATATPRPCWRAASNFAEAARARDTTTPSSFIASRRRPKRSRTSRRYLAHIAARPGLSQPDVPAAACLGLVDEYDRAIAIYERRYWPRISEAAEDPWLKPMIRPRPAHGRTARRRSSAAYQRCIAMAPSLGEAYWSLANLKTERDLHRLTTRRRCAKPPWRGPLSRSPKIACTCTMHWARRGRIAATLPTSFDHYAKEARLRHAEVALRRRMATPTRETRRSEALFTRSFFAAHAGVGCPSDAPIFIVGLPRSGSTLIEQILASHSAIEGTMELPDIAAMARWRA